MTADLLSENGYVDQ